jgi:hypothetical protein
MKNGLMYEQTVSVLCSDNDKTIQADVLSFVPGKKLTVSLNKSIKMEMAYQERNKIYVVNQTGLEFVSKGPKEILVKKGLRG